MWVYFNKNGELINYLEHGVQPTVGTSAFQIFAVFDEAIDTLNSEARIKLEKPDLHHSVYPPFLMQVDTKVFTPLEGETNYAPFVPGKAYNGYLFDFGQFTDEQDLTVLLDTPGTWIATIVISDINKRRKAAGQINFYVQDGAGDEENEKEVELNELLDKIYDQFGTKLNVKSDKYIKIINSLEDITPENYNNFNYENTLGEGNGDIVFLKHSKEFYRLINYDLETEKLTTVFLGTMASEEYIANQHFVKTVQVGAGINNPDENGNVDLGDLATEQYVADQNFVKGIIVNERNKRPDDEGNVFLGNDIEVVKDGSVIDAVSGETYYLAFVSQAKYNQLVAQELLIDNCYYFITDDSTLADLEVWKEGVEVGLTDWKTTTEGDLTNWKTATEEGLNAWKTETEASLNVWKSNVSSMINNDLTFIYLPSHSDSIFDTDSFEGAVRLAYNFFNVTGGLYNQKPVYNYGLRITAGGRGYNRNLIFFMPHPSKEEQYVVIEHFAQPRSRDNFHIKYVEYRVDKDPENDPEGGSAELAFRVTNVLDEINYGIIEEKNLTLIEAYNLYTSKNAQITYGDSGSTVIFGSEYNSTSNSYTHFARFYAAGLSGSATTISEDDTGTYFTARYYGIK